MTDFTEVILKADDFLVLVPKAHERITTEEIEMAIAGIPAPLKDRVLIVEGFDLFVGRPVT